MLCEWPGYSREILTAANIVIALVYFAMGAIHVREGGTGAMHYCYAGFIGSCGAGHAVMAWHVWVHSVPWAMAGSHGVTAVVSVITLALLLRVKGLFWVY